MKVILKRCRFQSQEAVNEAMKVALIEVEGRTSSVTVEGNDFKGSVQ
jgi:hypothetical protein